MKKGNIRLIVLFDCTLLESLVPYLTAPCVHEACWIQLVY